MTIPPSLTDIPATEWPAGPDRDGVALAIGEREGVDHVPG